MRTSLARPVRARARDIGKSGFDKMSGRGESLIWWMCVCVCVWVWERAVCVCVCVWVWERAVCVCVCAWAIWVSEWELAFSFKKDLGTESFLKHHYHSSAWGLRYLGLWGGQKLYSIKLEFFAKCYIKTHQLDWMAMRLGNEIQTFVKQAMYYYDILIFCYYMFKVVLVVWYIGL